LTLAEGGAVKDEYLTAILMAQKINSLLGGYVISPWDLDKIPEDWMAAFNGLLTRLPRYQKTQNEVKSYLKNWEKSHKGYNRR
jgi:hypothetical protein